MIKFVQAKTKHWIPNGIGPARLIAALLLIALPTACKPALMNRQEAVQTSQAARSIVRVTVTSQGYYFHRPWQQRPPVTRSAIGVVVPGNRVLVNGLLVADHRYIELETLDTQQKQRAEVETVDYEANLALLKPTDASFLKNRKPLEMTQSAVVGDDLTIWQVKPSGDVIPGRGKVISIELAPYSLGHFFLVHRLDGVLQYQYNNLTLPVIKGGRLAGLILRYSSSDRTIDMISPPVIRHFLEDAQDGSYQGFPLVGFMYGDTLDPQLRRYIGLPGNLGGIYVQRVIKGGPADQAGVQVGDVVTRMGDFSVSNTGQYDDPLYGRTSLVHLIRTAFHVGQSIPMAVFRGGKIISLKIKLDHRSPDEFLVRPYIIDRPADYLIVGGMVIQELSLSYLREYGKDWNSRAPIHLLYYNQNQDYLNGDGRNKIVIITGVIPTPYTIGYENLSDLVIQKINNMEIHKLADVVQALRRPINGFHKFETEQHPHALYLDAKEIPSIDKMIEERYRIPIPDMDIKPAQSGNAFVLPAGKAPLG